MTFSELSAIHELKWIRDLSGGGKHESRTRSLEREGLHLFTPEKYSQATLIRLKNMCVLPQFSKFAEHSEYLLDQPQTSA